MVGQTLVSDVCGSCVQHRPGGRLQHEFYLQLCSNLPGLDQACKVKAKVYGAGKGLPAMLSSVASEKACCYHAF